LIRDQLLAIKWNGC